MTLPSLFVVYSSADERFASELIGFLETGCDVRSLDGGCMVSPDELFDKVEEGLGGGATILVLSERGSPEQWPRERWEPLRVERNFAIVLLRECKFPPLLRRRNFFDATVDKLGAMRRLKRWVWQRDSAERNWSSDLEEVYATISDRSACMRVSAVLAERFVQEAEHEFARVLWARCQKRTLAQTAGDLAAQLGMDLVCTAEQNCSELRLRFLQRRYLLVLDAPRQEHIDGLLVENGRGSTLITTEPIRLTETPVSLDFARELMAARRFAEAYELYYQLMDAGAERADCARDLVWICEQWDRLEEADTLRPDSIRTGEQMSLFW